MKKNRISTVLSLTLCVLLCITLSACTRDEIADEPGDGQISGEDSAVNPETPADGDDAQEEAPADAGWQSIPENAPWADYTAPEALSYEEYFSVEREYAISAYGEGESDTVWYSDPKPDWWPTDEGLDYAMQMRIRNSPEGSLGLDWMGEEYVTWWPDASQVTSLSLTNQWVYLAVGDTLYRVRPSGEELETVQQFENGAVLQVLAHRREDVAFVLVQQEDAYEIYRYYGVSGTVDLMHTISRTPEPVDLALSSPASNWAIVWSMKNPEFVQLAEELYPEYLQTHPEIADEATGRVTYYGLLELEKEQFSGLTCYLNGLTGEYYELLSTSVYTRAEKTGTPELIGGEAPMYSNTLRTEENIAKNGHRWWQDYQD